MRPVLWLGLTMLGGAALLAGCGGSDSNSPPTIVMVAPADGSALTDSTVIFAADVRDDSQVTRVRYYVEGELVATVTQSPWQALVAVGKWASGEPVSITGDVQDDAGLVTTAQAISVTIDPALQTIPQIVGLAADATVTPARLRVTWLTFPQAVNYTYEVARDSLFTVPLLTATHLDTSVTTSLDAEGVFYVRVMANALSGETPFSRIRRFSNVPRYVNTVAVAGNQVGLLPILGRPDGGIVVLSYAVAALPAVTGVVPQLLGLSASGTLLWQQDVLTAAQQPLAAVPDTDSVVLAGHTDTEGWLARFALADGSQRWQQSLPDVALTALGAAGDGGLLVAGRDLAAGSDDAAVVVQLDAGGVEQGRVAFSLPTDRSVLQVLRPQTDVIVLAGDITGADGRPAGVWAVATADDGSELWRTRLGTADHYRLRSGALQAGSVALAGLMDTETVANRKGWAASLDWADGRLRWLRVASGWYQVASIAPSVAGRLAVAGYALQSDGRTLARAGELSDGGGFTWQVERAMGAQAMGWGVASDGLGGVTMVGTQSDAGTSWDVLILRADDHGDFADDR